MFLLKKKIGSYWLILDLNLLKLAIEIEPVNVLYLSINFFYIKLNY